MVALVLPVRAPLASNVLVHGQPLVVTGSGFGTKSRGLAPLIRDTQTNGIGTVDPQWAGSRPHLTGEISAGSIGNAMQIQPTNFNPQGSSVGPPHPFVSGIYAGTAYDAANPSGTPNWTYERFLRWAFTLPSTIQSGDTCCVYARWYERNDPVWNLQPTTGNNKHGGYGPYGYADTGPGESSAQSWIWNVNNGNPNNNTAATWLMELADNSSPFNTFEFPDRNGHSGYFYGHKLSPYNPANGWLLCELEMCIDTTLGPSGHGYVNLVCNGQRSSGNVGGVGIFAKYAGRTDNFMSISTTARSINFGCGMYGIPINDPTTTSYLADLLCDMSAGGVSGQCARAMIGDQPTHAASALLSPLDLRIAGAAWTNNQITGGLWKDKFVTGQNAYVHVVTESGGVLDNVMGTMQWA